MIQQYPCSVCHKPIGDKEHFFVIYVNYEFTLNAITSITLAISSYQTAVILGTVSIVTLKYMLLTI